MSKPVVRVMPFSVGDSPTVICRRKRSFVSSTRLHVIVSGSTSSRTNLRGEMLKNQGQSMLQDGVPLGTRVRMHKLPQGQNHTNTPVHARTDLLRSSSVRSAGSVLSMPSLRKRFNMTGAKLILPALSAGQRRR